MSALPTAVPPVLAIAGFCLAVLSLSWQAFTWLVDQRRNIVIRQIGTGITDRTFVTPGTGPTVYVLSVAIANESRRRGVVIANFRLRPIWSSATLEVIDGPSESDATASEYIIPATTLKYPRDVVLNHKLNGGGELPVGKTLSGILIFKGYESLPINMLHGTYVWAYLDVQLHDGSSFSERCWFRVDRGTDGAVWPPFKS
jgi:hypothetical protein